ncbi:MAG TPA: hypothetical protein EYP40_07530, partial [Chromatiales bacterium]|nr:hypothetical protein [Chromatiales bacterium]
MRMTSCNKVTTRRAILAFFLSVSILFSSFLQAGVLFAPQASAAAIAGLPMCLKWRPIGICVWLSCSLTGCKVRFSIKVQNYVPDAFVAVNTSGLALEDAAGHIEQRFEGKVHVVRRDRCL